MHRLHLHTCEPSGAVRPEHQPLPGGDRTTRGRSRNNRPNAGHGEDLIDCKLRRLRLKRGPVLSRRHEVQERAQKRQSFASHVRNAEDRHHAVVHNVLRAHRQRLLIANYDRQLARAGRLEQTTNVLQRLFPHVIRANVQLRDDHHQRHAQRERDAQMLLCHAQHSIICRHEQHAVVRHVRGKSKQRGLEVLLVSREIIKRDHFCRALHHVSPRQRPKRAARVVVHNGASRRKSHNLLRHRRRPPRLQLVPV
mmetsp:Transcript_10316/g.21693  ORF Transcript_10316/g.21693 Transcript_10316/m.21693 type:complete len:252 (+) Transcript_10316:330-1085(+)